MLYPNYDNFASLSTNHLEVGSHVKDQPYDIYSLKKILFDLPLINLTRPDSNLNVTGILDLPEERLPDWSELPVLDLFGSVTSESGIRIEGDTKRRQLAKCGSGTRHTGQEWTSLDDNNLFTCNAAHDKEMI